MLPISRLSFVPTGQRSDFRVFRFVYVQTFVRSKLSMIKLCWVQSCLYADILAFKIVFVQTVARSKFSMSRLSCIQACLCPDFHAFKVVNDQIFVRSNLLPNNHIEFIYSEKYILRIYIPKKPVQIKLGSFDVGCSSISLLD